MDETSGILSIFFDISKILVKSFNILLDESKSEDIFLKFSIISLNCENNLSLSIASNSLAASPNEFSLSISLTIVTNINCK